MKRLAFLFVALALLAGLLIYGLYNTTASVGDIRVPGNDKVSSVAEADNSDSAIATMMIAA